MKWRYYDRYALKCAINVIRFPAGMKHRVMITILLCLPLVRCNVPLFSYPPFWDYSKTKPVDTDLVGSYRVLKLRLPSDLSRQVTEKDSRITLNADHTATLTAVPEFDGFGQKLECRWSGSATWELNDKINVGWGWSVAFWNFHPSSKHLFGALSFHLSGTWARRLTQSPKLEIGRAHV